MQVKLNDSKYDLLANRFRTDFGMAESDANEVLPYFRFIRVNKKEILLREGDISKYLYFINKGCIRSYYISEEGTDATRNIFTEGKFSVVLNSFINEKPSRECLQTLEDTELLRMNKPDFTYLLETNSSWEKFYRIKLERSRIMDSSRLESFIRMNAKERYEHLLKHNPEFIRRFSNKIIASYLGITQENLSRLKKVK